MSKLMMLVAAKWREFSASIPEASESPAEEEVPDVSTSRPTRSSRAAAASREEPDVIGDDDDDEFEDSKGRKKRNRKKPPASGGAASGGTAAGKKGKVPTLKIKLGKRKRTSSDDVSPSEKDSDAEFEQMLKEAEEASKVVEEVKGARVESISFFVSIFFCGPSTTNRRTEKELKASPVVLWQVQAERRCHARRPRRRSATRTRRRRRRAPRPSFRPRMATATRRTTRTIARCASKAARSSCATRARAPTTWCASSPNSKRRPKAVGPARTALAKVTFV